MAGWPVDRVVMTNQLCIATLGIAGPWFVERVDFAVGQVVAANFVQHGCYLEVWVRRAKLPDGQVGSWRSPTGSVSGFNLLFEGGYDDAHPANGPLPRSSAQLAKAGETEVASGQPWVRVTRFALERTCEMVLRFQKVDMRWYPPMGSRDGRLFIGTNVRPRHCHSRLNLAKVKAARWTLGFLAQQKC
jgi:hypothetical protein